MNIFLGVPLERIFVVMVLKGFIFSEAQCIMILNLELVTESLLVWNRVYHQLETSFCPISASNQLLKLQQMSVFNKNCFLLGIYCLSAYKVLS